MGKAIRYVALTQAAHRTRGVREPEHVRKLFVRKPGDPRRDQPPVEFVEKRPSVEENYVQTAVTGTQGLEQAESSRVLKLAEKFINSKGVAIAFQKNAWNSLRSENDPEYSNHYHFF
jgi:hypothetical protein